MPNLSPIQIVTCDTAVLVPDAASRILEKITLALFSSLPFFLSKTGTTLAPLFNEPSNLKKRGRLLIRGQSGLRESLIVSRLRIVFSQFPIRNNPTRPLKTD